MTERTIRVNRGSEAAGKIDDWSHAQHGAVGGRVTFGDREFLADGRHFQLVAGESYLVLLIFQEQLGMFVSSEFDVFNVDGPRVRVAGRRTLETPYGRELVGRASREAIGAVREALRR